MMISKEDIEVMKQIDIKDVSPDTLIDISEITIKKELPKKERIIDFIRQIKNPYCFTCGDMVVKLSFTQEETTLEEKIEELFTST